MLHQRTPTPSRRPRIAIVTNMPSPYRIPVFAALPALTGAEVHCIYLTRREPNRDWRVDDAADTVRVHYPPSRELTVRDKYIHFNTGLPTLLTKIAPDAIVTTAFGQPYLSAFLHAWRHGIPHVPMTDGTYESELHLTRMHHLLRRIVFRRSHAFVGASVGSRRLFASYGIAQERCFQSHLCADMARFEAADLLPIERTVDFVVSGRMHPDKSPEFALDVALGVARQLGRRVTIEFLGSGPLRDQLQARATAAADLLDVRLPGFLDQTALPLAYRRGRVLLFPTRGDVWGVVVNEACAVGLPVLQTPMAGTSGEIVRDHENGRILPLDLPAWIDAASALLTDAALWQRMSARSRELVAGYTYANAAHGLAQALAFAMHHGAAASDPA
ncbi:glycosyltransferase family 4 protein [Sphaerotilus sp.]|uniref:glycosyltransferase family 4 protein n=1 Tax=Sphaerotilus sp. TaxID=2093942 RepID=UPI0034E27F70